MDFSVSDDDTWSVCWEEIYQLLLENDDVCLSGLSWTRTADFNMKLTAASPEGDDPAADAHMMSCSLSSCLHVFLLCDLTVSPRHVSSVSHHINNITTKSEWTAHSASLSSLYSGTVRLMMKTSSADIKLTQTWRSCHWTTSEFSVGGSDAQTAGWPSSLDPVWKTPQGSIFTVEVNMKVTMNLRGGELTGVVWVGGRVAMCQS